MTKPIAPELRRRPRMLPLDTSPGTIASIATLYIDEKRFSRKRLQNVRKAIRDLKDAIGRDPHFSDFTAENIAATRTLLKSRHQSGNHVSSIVSMLKRVWKWCATKGYAAEPPPCCQPLGKPGNPDGHVWNPVNGKQLKVSDAPGGLWHLCLTQFFPRYIRITRADTKKHYRYAVRELSEVLGRDPTVADLTDDNLAAMVNQCRAKGRAPETINGLTGRLRTLWTWLAKRRIVDTFPTLGNVKEPRRVPKAWTRDDLDKLIRACRNVRGKFGPGLTKADWWVALHLVLWDTSERIGAALSIRKEWLNWQTGDLLIPAEYRKGQEQDMQYRLHPDTLTALAKIRDNGSDLLFHQSLSLGGIYAAYKGIRRSAGLPLDRKSAFHRMRRSVASHLHAGGFNATDALGHASAEVTRRSYLDPSISGAVRPADVLFRPGGYRDDGAMSVTAVKLSAREARQLPRAKVVAG
jgi:integrase